MAAHVDDLGPAFLQAFEAFDGKHVDGLRALIKAPVTDKALLAVLPGTHEVGASWVLKGRAEAGLLDTTIGPSLFGLLPVLTAPDAILHLLQMVQYVPGANTDHIRPFLTHKRTLLRVWALDALVHCSPEEAAPLVEAGLQDPSAAMRARARALQKSSARRSSN